MEVHMNVRDVGNVVVMLPVISMSTYCMLVKRIKSYCSEGDYHEVSLFLEEWGWRVSGRCVSVFRVKSEGVRFLIEVKGH
jgi:hypothetical protein